MNCDKVQKSLSAFLDSSLPGPEQSAIAAHLSACRGCSGRSEDLREVLFHLRGLRSPAAPSVLSSRLRIVASHEVARRRGDLDFSTGFRRWLTRAHISMRDLMRPLALPAAGGVLSSIFFFVMLVDNFAFQRVKNDIPLVASTPRRPSTSSLLSDSPVATLRSNWISTKTATFLRLLRCARYFHPRRFEAARQSHSLHHLRPCHFFRPAHLW